MDTGRANRGATETIEPTPGMWQAQDMGQCRAGAYCLLFS